MLRGGQGSLSRKVPRTEETPLKHKIAAGPLHSMEDTTAAWQSMTAALLVNSQVWAASQHSR